MTGDRLENALERADDRIVAGRAADGDVAAFAVLVRRYTPMMRAYTRRMLPGSADVDDVVQEAFVTAWQRLPELDDPSKVKSWLMRVVSRKAVDRIRATRSHADVDEIEHQRPRMSRHRTARNCMPNSKRSAKRCSRSPPTPT